MCYRIVLWHYAKSKSRIKVYRSYIKKYWLALYTDITSVVMNHFSKFCFTRKRWSAWFWTDVSPVDIAFPPVPVRYLVKSSEVFALVRKDDLILTILGKVKLVLVKISKVHVLRNFRYRSLHIYSYYISYLKKKYPTLDILTNCVPFGVISLVRVRDPFVLFSCVPVYTSKTHIYRDYFTYRTCKMEMHEGRHPLIVWGTSRYHHCY